MSKWIKENSENNSSNYMSNLKSKIFQSQCESCGYKFKTKFISHKYCNYCFYNNSANQHAQARDSQKIQNSFIINHQVEKNNYQRLITSDPPSKIAIKFLAENRFGKLIKCSGLLDTGTSSNVIPIQFLVRYNFMYKPRQTAIQGKTAHPNAPIDIIGDTAIRFGLTQIHFHVSKQDISEYRSHDFILGTPFLVKTGIMEKIKQLCTSNNFEIRKI